jgi:hypothetical protein
MSGFPAEPNTHRPAVLNQVLLKDNPFDYERYFIWKHHRLLGM